MSSFAPQVSTPAAKPPDPTKHVNFTQGMVLGVDDFTQEFAYLANRDQWLARDLLGYGTVSGLQVSSSSDPQKGPGLVVSPGTALSPEGQLICVDPAQCAYLNDWLDMQEVRKELVKRLVSPPDDQVQVYLTLCYRDCPSDALPVPGEPCRTEAEDDSSLLKPSRIQDDFRLELRWQAPEQREEDALRDFVAWLRQIELVESLPGDPEADLEAFAEAIRAATQLFASHPASFPESLPGSPPDYLYGSPPAGLKIPGALACDYLRTAFRIWTAELRPLWRGSGAGCCTPPGEACLLLAEVTIPVVDPGANQDWEVDTTREILIDETRRPYLIHLRLLQEWMLCGRNALLTPSDHVEAETAFGIQPHAGTSELYSRANHTHGTPDDPIPPHVADPDAHALVGDVTGVVGDNTVSSLQGTRLAASAMGDLAADEVLTLRDGLRGLEWRPEPIPNLAGDVTGPIRRTRLSRIQGLMVHQFAPRPPEAGMVLTLTEAPGRRGTPQIQWRAAHLPAPVYPNLAGDVNGAPAANLISSLQGKPLDALNPGHNQVLTFVRGDPASGTADRWVPAELPEGEAQALAGDVNGAPGANLIGSLQGKPLDALSPGYSQVLTFVRGDPASGTADRWVPAEPPQGGVGTLDGDVTGAGGDNTISRLQDGLVKIEGVKPGQILRFEEDTGGEEPRWKNVDPPFVLRPPNAGPAAIVAAGIFRFSFQDQGSQAERLQSYNELYVVDANFVGGLPFGTIKLKFNGYVNPFPEDPSVPAAYFYIVKLTPWMTKYPFLAEFLGFTDDGMDIGVEMLPGRDEPSLEGIVMVEISEFRPPMEG